MANWVAIATFILLVCGAIPFVLRWHQWRNPVEVRYLIPRNVYPEVKFNGAPSHEELRRHITTGIGRYEIMIQIKARTNMEITQARFVIHETGSGTRPQIRETPPSRFSRNAGTDYLGRHQYIDWSGELRTSEDFDYPRAVIKGDTGTLTRVIETTGKWDGQVVILLAMRDNRFSRPGRYALPLYVNPDGDEVPFLHVPPPLSASVDIETTFPILNLMVIRLQITNQRRNRLQGISFNLRVPADVQIFATNQQGDALPNTPASRRATETLYLEDGTAYPNPEINYVDKTDIAINDRWVSEMFYGLDARNVTQPIPIRLTVHAPELGDPLELRKTLYWEIDIDP